MDGNDFSDGITKAPIVIDNVSITRFSLRQGSGVIKAGFGGEEAPAKVFNSL